MTKRKGTLIFGGGALLLALGVVAFVRSRQHDLVLIGVVDANEIVVTPPVQARLDSLWIEEGTEVKAGEPIATLDRGELAAQAQAAGASAASLRAQLAQVSLSAQQTAGEAASAVSAARARLAVARAESARQEAELTRERADEGRATKLASSGGLSPQELERATTALHVQEQVVNAAHESLRAAEADVQRAVAGELAVRAARGSVAASQARLQGARADSVAASMRLGYTELRAPASGVVQVLAARRGELVGPGTPVAIIVVPDQLWVRVAAPESDAGAVAVGDSLEVRFPSGEKTRGRVISKSAEGEFATQHDVSASKRDIRVVAFRVAIPNPKRTIVPGVTASVVLPTDRP
ncbi:MAG TPA: efflux RND transporter periplasmic adaptor subunit [Gemmatimonadaceae bacterium]